MVVYSLRRKQMADYPEAQRPCIVQSWSGVGIIFCDWCLRLLPGVGRHGVVSVRNQSRHIKMLV